MIEGQSNEDLHSLLMVTKSAKTPADALSMIAEIQKLLPTTNDKAKDELTKVMLDIEITLLKGKLAQLLLTFDDSIEDREATQMLSWLSLMEVKSINIHDIEF